MNPPNNPFDKDAPRCESISEPIPLIGGPYDGQLRSYSILFPDLKGGIPSAGLIFGNHVYQLSKDRKQWYYMGIQKREAK